MASFDRPALLIVATVAFQYGINAWNRLIFDTIEKRDAATVFHLTGIFFPLAIGSVVLGVAQVFTRMSVQRRWRAWATHAVVSLWLKNGRYYQLNLVGGDHQDPETRIAEDLQIATDSPVDFVSGVTSVLLSAVTFIVVLWTIGGALTLPIGGSVIDCPPPCRHFRRQEPGGGGVSLRSHSCPRERREHCVAWRRERRARRDRQDVR